MTRFINWTKENILEPFIEWYDGLSVAEWCGVLGYIMSIMALVELGRLIRK